MRATGRASASAPDAGVATAFVLASAALALAAVVAILCWAATTAEAARTARAADLAALAAAGTARGTLPAADPCVVAAEVAAKNRSRLSECTLLQGDGATVRVTLTARRGGAAARFLPLPAAAATSFAGPPPDSTP